MHGRAGGRDGRRDQRGPLAEPAAQRPEVRLHGHVDHVGGGALDGGNVELVGDLGAQVRGQPGELGRRHDRACQRLARAHTAARSGCPAELDKAADEVHLGCQPGVHEIIRGPRPVGQMDRVRGLRPDADDQLRPQRVGQERRERGHQPGQAVQAGVEGVQGVRIGLPEAPPGAPHVPVGQVVDEAGQASAGPQRVERVQRLGDLRDGRVQFREHPAVEHGARPRVGRGSTAWCPAAGIGVEDEERRGVPVGQQHLADDVLKGLMTDPAVRPGGPGREHQPAHRVRAVPVEQLERVQHVTDVLAHLAAVGVEQQAQAQHGLVGGAVEHQRPHGHQRVEPATGLVDGLADVLRRVLALELFAVAVRGSPLGERHRSAVVPDVDHFRYPPRHRRAGRAGDRHVIDERPVRVERGQVTPGQAGQFQQRSDAGQVGRIGRAAPDRQRRAPVAAARQRPVDVATQPFAEPPVLDPFGVPVGAFVLRQQPVSDRGGPDVPGRQRIVDQRRVAAPAVRIAVGVVLGPPQHPTRAQIVDEGRVRVLEEHPADQRGAGEEPAVPAHRVDHGQAVGAGDGEVLGAEGRGLVHQPGAVGRGDVVGEHHRMRGPAAEIRHRQQFERPGVGHASEIASPKSPDDLGVRAHRGTEQRLGHQHQLTVAPASRRPGDDIGDVGMRGDRGVGHQRPWGGRPDEQAHPGVTERAGGHREADVHRGIDHVGVSLGDLVVGQGGLVARAVRRDPVVLDEQALVKDLLEGPPDALDVGGVHRPVGVVQITPVAHALGHPGEVRDVAQHRLAAAGVERGDPEGLDVALAGEAQLLFHGELHRQAVAVPAGAARDVEATHRPVAGEQVLEDPGFDVVGAGLAVGGGRTLIEDPLWPVRGRGQ